MINRNLSTRNARWSIATAAGAIALLAGVGVSEAGLPTIVYSNVTNPAEWTGGAPVFFGAGNTFVADDLHLVGGGRLSEFTVSMGNQAGYDYIGRLRLSVRSYGPSGAIGDEIGWVILNTNETDNFTAGEETSLTWVNIDIGGAEIDLPEDGVVWVGFELLDAAPDDLIGPMIYDPPGIGSSDDMIFWVDHYYWFGSNPIANFAFELVTVPIPPAGSCNPADVAEPFGVLDLADINVYANAFYNSDPIADLNNDGVFDLLDIGLFVDAFQAGCP